MAIRTGYNGQVSRGLIFAFDSADFFNSYKGEPAVNTIPSPQINSYPTFGNGWATYNTNKYCGNNGCAVYWDIPSIASVSNNIITTNGSHGIYSFDVIRPETSGGGVSAGTDYFAKKISDTQFSLHAYNGSQGGDQGYINPATGGHKVHDSFWLDQRVSVSASGFPTKWWGAPHLPNSGLVKEIITGGFDRFPSQKTDCMRLHAHRPESADGMAYGPDAVVVPGQVHTYSFWTRALNERTANGGGSMSNYNYGSVSPTSWGHGYTHGPLGVWTRQSFQFTPINENVISYFWPGALEKYDLANIQVERNSHPTPFVAGTRSNTGALLDIAGGSTLDVANVSFDSNAQIVFDGTDDEINTGITTQLTDFSCEVVFKDNGSAAWGRLVDKAYTNGFFISSYFASYGAGYVGAGIVEPNPPHGQALQYDTSKYNYFVVTRSGTTHTIYLNGSTNSLSKTGSSETLGTAEMAIGAWYGSTGSQRFTGEIPVVKLYNRALTSNEIQQNFNSYKKRFNL